MGQHTVAIIDDEAPIRKALRRILKYEPYHVVDFGKPEEAMEYVRSNPVSLVISDHTMPGMLGMDLLRTVRLVKPNTIRMILTGNANLEMALKAINEGAIYRFLTKPWDNDELLVSIRLGIRQYETEAENRRLAALVRKHQAVLERLEREQPGVTGLQKEPEGRVVLDELDIEEALAEAAKFGE
jgi:two-component system, probable response regulator PhcQ